MSALPPNDPHGYIHGTVFAAGMLFGGFLAIATFLIGSVAWH